MHQLRYPIPKKIMTTCIVLCSFLNLNADLHAQTINLSTDAMCNSNLGSVSISLNTHGLVNIQTGSYTPSDLEILPIAHRDIIHQVKPKLCKYNVGNRRSQTAWLDETDSLPSISIVNGEFNSEYTILQDILVNTRSWLECTTLYQCFSFTNRSETQSYQLSFMPSVEGKRDLDGLSSVHFNMLQTPQVNPEKSMTWYSRSGFSPSVQLNSSFPNQFDQWEVNLFSAVNSRFNSISECPSLINQLLFGQLANDVNQNLVSDRPDSYLMAMNVELEQLLPGEDSPEYCYEIKWDYEEVCSDEDDDDICFEQDNCPTVSNPNQESTPNGLGSLCQNSTDDYDFDTISEGDNCPLNANPEQIDSDNDGIGDVCDNDTDNDGINDEEDNCPTIINPGQGDEDLDGVGNACDDDMGLTFTSNPLICDPELGSLVIDLDEFGAFGSANGQANNHYDPPNDTPDQGGVRTIFQGFSFLCTENANGVANGTWLSTNELPNSDIQFNRSGNRLSSEFNYRQIQVNIESELQCTTLRTCYTFTNQSNTVLSTVSLTSYLDGDLYFGTGGLSNDYGGMSSSRPIALWQFDEGGDRATETPFVALSARDHDHFVTSWEIGSFSEQRARIQNTTTGCTELRNDINRAQSNIDVDGDLVTDRGYDVSVAMRFDVGPLQQGETSSEFCVETAWTEGSPCSDEDFDEICFTRDNCPTVYNPNQEDFDGDGLGDFCEQVDHPLDLDFDGIIDGDNCPFNANAEQEDLDQDGEGDVCDPDIDGDRIRNEADSCPNTVNLLIDSDSDGVDDACDRNLDSDQDMIDDGLDNCIDVPNQRQEDLDQDGQGDLCDTDQDGDGINNAQDICPRLITPTQNDLDQDGLGDYCDSDIDGDGVQNNEDACPFDDLIGLMSINDIDEDGLDDSCDGDIDGDSISNELDNCPSTVNINQIDQDLDGQGDVCDEDLDGDGLEQSEAGDYCPYLAESVNDNRDLDMDGLGNSCDADDDGDGIPDARDNCPLLNNPDQLDTDRDQIGNVCDSSPDDASADRDGDAVIDQEDNCPTIRNPDQNDIDEDGLGDQCDYNIDGDRYDNQNDLCPLLIDNGQDQDRDGFGDACDQDRDGDGLSNETDNCPDLPNSRQTDLDRDGLGDACDADRDGDFIQNDEDLCPDFNFTQTEDIDGDGLGDDCDPNINDAEPELSDEDNDGYSFVSDNCTNVYNPEQTDLDQDGQGDLCDDDLDGDGVSNQDDNCPRLANAGQVDLDEDLLGDYCETTLGLDPQNPDSDEDGVLDGEDNCPLLINAEQEDLDQDGIGSACDDDETLGEAGTEMMAGDSLAGQMTAGEAMAGEMTAGNSLAGQMTAGDMLAGQMTAGEIGSGETNGGEITLTDEENTLAGSENEDEEEMLNGNRDIKPTGCHSTPQGHTSLWWLIFLLGFMKVGLFRQRLIH